VKPKRRITLPQLHCEATALPAMKSPGQRDRGKVWMRTSAKDIQLERLAVKRKTPTVVALGRARFACPARCDAHLARLFSQNTQPQSNEKPRPGAV
jgi:hypothetical protein